MRSVIHTVLEFLIVLGIGLGFALAANAVSPHGLMLTKDYFPKVRVDRPATQPVAAATKPATTTDSSDTTSVTQATPQAGDEEEHAEVFEMLRADGLQPMTHEEAVSAFEDPLYKERLIVFLDARSADHFRDGHIPGAMRIDRARVDESIAQLHDLLTAAIKIVVYCGGGDCEDSKYAAIELLNHGIDPALTYVYVGGFTSWTKNDMPVEKGS
jgi:rhodanese-related sulfurtransferase